MSNTVNINIKTDLTLKQEAETLFKDLGMNMTTALNIFLRQSVRQHKIPFEISQDVPNKRTRAAMHETEALLKSKNIKTYSTFNELLNEVQNEV